jgi:hypothetical protein
MHHASPAAAASAGGWLILTLKFYGRGREKATMVQHLDKYFQVGLE